MRSVITTGSFDSSNNLESLDVDVITKVTLSRSGRELTTMLAVDSTWLLLVDNNSEEEVINDQQAGLSSGLITRGNSSGHCRR